MKKLNIFVKREIKIQKRLFIDELLYGNRYFIKDDNPSLFGIIKCLIFGGSPYIKRIDPTKVCIWHTPQSGKTYGKSTLDND